MKRIYLDYAATTPVDPIVKKAMEPYFSEKFGNPSSLHFFGQQAMTAVDESREKIAKIIGANFREIIFTGSATEANNLALRGAVKKFDNFRAVAFQKQNNFAPAAKFSSPSARQFALGETKLVAPAGRSSRQSALNQIFLPLRIIVSAIEHESILETCRDLEKEGIEVIYLPVNREGLIDLKKLKEALNEWTVLVSIMYANNEVGTIQPISAITKIIKEFRIKNLEFRANNNPQSSILNPQFYPLLHTDAVQAFQYLDCNVNKLGVDFMTLSGHKIYGPKGIGLLYRRIQNKELRIKDFNNDSLNPQSSILNSIITGGGQEFGFRSGTENMAAIVGFAKAAEIISSSRELENRRIGKLADYFWKQIKKIYPKAEINGIMNNKSGIMDKKINFIIQKIPNILNIYFPGKSAEELLIKLDLAGMAVSSGSACSTRSSKPSHVLKSCGLPENRIKSSLRISLGKFTTKAEIDEAIKRIAPIV
ncbi:MAG: cysteine desulfurase family protein [Patescibacteria group bacterium]